MTSFQWCSSRSPERAPSCSRPTTSFFVTRSQSSRRNSTLIRARPSVLQGTSNRNDSLKTGLRVRFLTRVFFLAIRCPLYMTYIFTYGSATEISLHLHVDLFYFIVEHVCSRPIMLSCTEQNKENICFCRLLILSSLMKV